MKHTRPDDPKGLIYEAYQIEGITSSQCRTIFLDWALSLPAGHEPNQAISDLLEAYGAQTPNHPMSQVLRDGLKPGTPPRRRGGWRTRPRGPA